jgi:hypothetical protein
VELAQLFSATRAVELNSETTADLEFLRGRGTSLGGLRPKCSIIDGDGSLAIGKFPSVSDERAVTRGEVLALRLARKAGIDAADARLVESGGAQVAVIRRFDRTEDGDLGTSAGRYDPSSVSAEDRRICISRAGAHARDEAAPTLAAEHFFQDIDALSVLDRVGLLELLDVEELRDCQESCAEGVLIIRSRTARRT